MRKTVVELFAGVGGFRVGLNHINEIDENGDAIENGDWVFEWANQWEPSTKAQPAFNCYCERFKKDESTKHSNINIQEVDKSKIPEHALLVGGFPCQDYSVARSLSGEKGIQGKKGVLFWEIAEILKLKKPPFVLLENVDRLLKSPSNQRGRDFGIMLRTFDDNGYNVEWRVINAAEYGARQRRRRTFIFAWHKDTSYNGSLTKLSHSGILFEHGLFAKTFHLVKSDNNNQKIIDISSNTFTDAVEMSEKFQYLFDNAGCMIDGKFLSEKTFPIEKNPTPLKKVLESKVDKKFFLNENQLEKFEYLKGAKRILRYRPNGEEYYYSEGPISYPENLDLPGRTMLTSEGTINRSTHVVSDLETGAKRFITPVEAERLQHFPDNWTAGIMTDRQRYFMMGNALVTFIISSLEPLLSEIIENE